MAGPMPPEPARHAPNEAPDADAVPGPGPGSGAFPTLRYDRICRTSHSEAFLLSEHDEPLGRVDLHYGASVVHGLLLVERELPDEDVQWLVARLDEDLVWTADRPRDDFLVTVYRGTEIGVYSDHVAETEDEEAADRLEDEGRG